MKLMDLVFREFYRNFYIRTGGFSPVKPLNQNVYPGDFFQIRNGEVIVLGNIFRNGVIQPEDVRFENGVSLNPSHWDFGSGVTTPYSGRGSGEKAIKGEFEYCRQVLAFQAKGSFFFRGAVPESVKIANWNEIAQELIIKLTQTQYSFRELYVVTEAANTENWTLAVANSKKAELEIAMHTEQHALVDFFGHGDSRTVQSRDIEYYNQETGRKSLFFRAKKLAIQQEKLDIFISELISKLQYHNEWVGDFFEYDFHRDTINTTSRVSNNAQGSILDLLQANELNPNNALLYFRWVDMNLDDIEKLFLTYGG